jgi:hypothetical protein
MPKTIVTTYTCSLCPKTKQTPLTESEVSTFRFEDGGRTYEQFFCQAHGAAVKEGAELLLSITLAPAPTRTTGGTRRSTPQLIAKEDTPACRAWLESQGNLKAGSRGRISAELQQTWINAGSPQLPS